MVEEVYEKKMEIFSKSVKKTHSKRARIQEDSEDYVPVMMYTALEAKLEVCCCLTCVPEVSGVGLSGGVEWEGVGNG